MDFSDPEQRRVFFEIHDGLPRQAPGSEASTLTALERVQHRLPAAPFIADMGCGPGSSVLALARALPKARFLAIDLHAPFVEDLKNRATDQNLSKQIDAQVADMLHPPLQPHSLDMIWCEGAIYNCGLYTGLRTWRKYLKPNGLLVFNDVIWLVPEHERPVEAKAFWAEYPSMMDQNGAITTIHASDYEVIDAFNLPDTDWWASYYTPIEERLDNLEQHYKGNCSAEMILTAERTEINIRKRFFDTYAYRFFITKIT